MVIRKIKESAEATKNGAIHIVSDMREHTTTAIAAAFAFIIALTWRDAIRKIIDSFVVRLGVPETAYLHEIIVAIVITTICVVGILIVSKYSVKKEKEDKKKKK